ncbi:MAG: SDR family oxidoreductase [Dehalococcoidia bacterium]|nr:SDR family oxidoreductase [Dehalococcoidia bacterium]MSQ34977.1 SDR family oxidoreductase [Dehalococcoidia bacterium]
MAQRFSGKVAIVTGAASGIGRAVALALAGEGAAVTLTDVDRARGEAALTDAVAQGARAIFIEADVSKADHASRIVDQTVAAFGGVDLLVNNAGVELVSPLAETSEADWDRVLGVNLKGAFLCSKAAIPEMVKRGGGAVVNVASIAGKRAPRRSTAYVVSKAGLIALTQSAAGDYAKDGVRVNCVAPGMTDTPMLRRSAEAVSPAEPQAVYQEWAKGLPLGRPGSAEEVAAAVLFLASAEASFITGVTLDVDGGSMSTLT